MNSQGKVNQNDRRFLNKMKGIFEYLCSGTQVNTGSFYRIIFNKNSPMIVLRTFDNYFSANILLTRLQDAGVECFLFDENTVTMGPILSTAIGKIKLVTHKKNADTANQLLLNFEKEYMENAVCPACGGSDFIQVPRKETKNMMTAIVTWFFSSYAIAPDQVYHCRKCGYENENLPETTIADN